MKPKVAAWRARLGPWILTSGLAATSASVGCRCDQAAPAPATTTGAQPAPPASSDVANEGGLAAAPTASGSRRFNPSAAITAPDGGPRQYFGSAVSAWGDLLLVGAPREGGDGRAKGAAYVYRRGSGSWHHVAKLQPRHGERGNLFGTSVSLDAGVAIVSAGHLDLPNEDPGSAYIFQRSAGGWTQAAKLRPDPLGSLGYHAVALSAAHAIVGADGEDANTTHAGAAYVFERRAGSWTQVAALKDRATQKVNNTFGSQVAISGDRVVVSGDVHAGGAVFVYERRAGRWEMDAKLTPSPATSGFGAALDVDDDRIVVGALSAPHTEATAEQMRGAVFLFEQRNAGWVQVAHLAAPPVPGNNLFGRAVALGGRHAVVGMPRSGRPGLAYVYRRTAGTWTAAAAVQAGERSSANQFGSSLAIAGDRLLVGAPTDSRACQSCGAVYEFSLGALGTRPR